MRDYAKISPLFWTGDTGKKIREAGSDAQRVAFYLLTCPSSNWIGLYYLPLPTLCHEIGISEKGASKALRSLSEAHFAYWDAPSEVVFVPEMARYQVGDRLDEKDKRIKGIAKELKCFVKSKFHSMFYEKYRDRYHLPEPSPFEAPSKPLRSQEQEIEQEQEEESPLSPQGVKATKRVPKEFIVTEDMVCWAHQKCPGIDVAFETERFRDCEFKTPHKDWPATWRNWMRTAYGRNGKSSDTRARPVDVSEIPGAMIDNEPFHRS